MRFFKNHGLLQIGNRPQWRVLQGGSRSYLDPITALYQDSIRVDSEVIAIERNPNGNKLRLHNGQEHKFDHVVIATHSDQALAMLSDADSNEQDILKALPYSDNEVVLHTDESLLPSNKRAWSSWNYRLRSDTDRATLTYNMNILQGLSAPETFCVTLNDSDAIKPSSILGEYSYAHPQFTIEGIAAQARWNEINGPRNTFFCGAYWQNGFHEDGLSSGLRAANALIAKLRAVA